MKIAWHEKLGLPECPYMERWVVDFGPFAVRLHHWSRSDDPTAFHDHAWWFVTLVLSGEYHDLSPDGVDILKTGSIRFRSALHKHTVDVKRPTWTLMITGAPKRKWGFWVKGKLIKREKYFAEVGHHPCDPATQPWIRRRPNGTRI